MFKDIAREILEDFFQYIEDVEPDWRVMRRLHNAPAYDLLVRRLGVIVESRLIRVYRREVELQWRSELDAAMHQHSAQLDRIERAVKDNRIECRYRVGDPQATEFMSVKKETVDDVEKAVADPDTFVNELRKVAELASALIIVDPYALSAEDEAGQSVSARKTIKKIFDACRSDKTHLHLYCRMDAIDETEWQKLESDLGVGNLSVHIGDLHDRYILAGRETSYDGYGDTHPSPGWHGFKYWGGAAFGASINGVGKRPTYVLNFKKADIDPLRFYLDSVAKDVTTLEKFKKKKAATMAMKVAKSK